MTASLYVTVCYLAAGGGLTLYALRWADRRTNTQARKGRE